MVRAFFESLSLGSGAALIAVVSGSLAWPLGRIRSTATRWCTAVLVPFALSYCCYWMPVWLGGSGDQYSSWEVLIVGVWFVAGLLGSAIITFIVERHATRTI